MSKLWANLVRWLAQEHIAYLEYENQELRYEGERWRHRCEGALDALQIFERRSAWLEETVTDAAMLKPTPMIITQRPAPPKE
jgi:hypothetical protein